MENFEVTLPGYMTEYKGFTIMIRQVSKLHKMPYDGKATNNDDPKVQYISMANESPEEAVDRLRRTIDYWEQVDNLPSLSNAEIADLLVSDFSSNATAHDRTILEAADRLRASVGFVSHEEEE